MAYFHYQNNEFYAEQVKISDIVEKFGTPCYIYSRTAIEQQWNEFHHAFGNYPHRICYAVKANSNVAILNLLARLGSGFDIVSGGELARVLHANGKPQNIIFSGIGKQTAEIQQALAANIFCFDIESKSELLRLNEIAEQMHSQASIALRINPDIETGTHPYIATALKENKFGIAMDEAFELYCAAAKLPYIKIIGIACHLGSQITSLEPYLIALERLLELIDRLRQNNITISYLNLGGGFGVHYYAEEPPTPKEFVHAILAKLANRNLEIILEPGRSIIAKAGILVTKVEYLKYNDARNFAIVDAAMNDFMRPALYGAWHEILPVKIRNEELTQLYDVVGPVCETADFLAKGRSLNLNEGDLLAINSTGAYGFSMSSNYNSRPRPAEILVDKDQFHLIRKREQIEDLFSGEVVLDR